MHTEICDLFGIDVPIFAFTHCRDVVVAVSKAGGMGVLGVVGFSPEQIETELAWIDQNVGDKPYGVDTVIPNKYEAVRVVAKEARRINAVLLRAAVGEVEEKPTMMALKRVLERKVKYEFADEVPDQETFEDEE